VPGLEETTDLEPGVDERVVQVGNRPVERHEHGVVPVVDRDLATTGVEVTPLERAGLQVEQFVQRVGDAEHEHAVLAEDTVGLGECPVEVTDHLVGRLRGRHVEALVGEGQVRQVALQEADIDTVELPQLAGVAQLLPGEVHPDHGVGTQPRGADTALATATAQLDVRSPLDRVEHIRLRTPRCVGVER
jgi:hypothetical protein